LRRPSRGILGLNFALSVSHDTSANITYAVLVGCSQAQQTFIKKELERLRDFAAHPLLIPILLTIHQQILLHVEAEGLWEGLLHVETASGRTGVPVVGLEAPSKGRNGTEKVQVDVLRVAQLASAWESEARALSLGIESMMKSLDELDRLATAGSRLEGMSKVLRESLTLTSHKASVMLWDLEFIKNRVDVQMSAVRSSLSSFCTRISHSNESLILRLGLGEQLHGPADCGGRKAR
jgi:hypothetical protein